MSDMRQPLPHLDEFLNGYMHQDWRIFGDTLEDVVAVYASDTSHLQSSGAGVPGLSLRETPHRRSRVIVPVLLGIQRHQSGSGSRRASRWRPCLAMEARR
jgi:hypothetical protein